MAVLFDAATSGSCTTCNGLTFASPGTGAENFGVAFSFNISGGVSVPTTSATWNGSGMTNSGNVGTSLAGSFVHVSVWSIVGPPAGPGSVVFSHAFAATSFMHAVAVSLTGGGSSGTVLSTSSTSATSSSIGIVASAQSIVLDGVGDATGGTPPPPLLTIGPGQTLNAFAGSSTTGVLGSSREIGSGGTNTMSWTSLGGGLSAHIAIVIDPPVVFAGFDGVQYTAEGTNDPRDKGAPSFPAFPSFGAATPSPYDTFKKLMEIDGLLANAKLI